MPNRIIKESIRTSKSVNSMTDFQFRLWVYLITYVDDYGRGSADPEILKGFCFPRRKRVTESDIQKALAELADSGCIHLYKVDGESYLCLPNWSKHQRIQTKKSRFPSPENAESYSDPRCSTVSHGESPPESKYESNPNTNPNPSINTGGKRPVKHKHGEFGHVLLTDEEYKKLLAYPAGEEYIAKVDEGIEQYGYKYNNHYLAVLNWMERGGVKTKETRSSAPAPSALAKDAIARMMQDAELPFDMGSEK